MMMLLRNHDYTISQPTNYKSCMSITWEQKFLDLMIQHKIEEICSVNNIRSIKLEVLLEPSAIFGKLLGQ